MIRTRHHRERGQVIPVWIGAILTTFALMFFGLNYANAIRWQLRAQNAADAAAQGVLAIQTQRWNLMLQTLYAMNVEEYRIRHLLDGLLLAVNDSGGCTIDLTDYTNNTEDFSNGTCSESYVTLNAAYIKAVSRYTTDVQLLNDISALSTDTAWSGDARLMVNHLSNASNCNSMSVHTNTQLYNPSGGDCAFQYTIPSDGIAYRTGLEAVEMDAYGDLVPGLGRVATYHTNDSENAALFAPAKVDIVTCAVVPPVIPSFGPFQAKPYYAVGRAAAQAVQVEQDWFEPGALVDPIRNQLTNQFFQPTERYNGVEPNVQPTGNDWYDVDYGGNVAIATSYLGEPYFSEPFYVNEMSARMGWWNAITTQPFSKQVSLASDCPAGS